MSRAGLVSLLAILPLAGPPAAAEGLSGAAKARAADTVAVAGARVRLAGVMVPPGGAVCAGPGEAARPCEAAATAALEALLAAGAVSCTTERRLGHGYFLGRCRMADGADPAEALLARGLLLPAAGALPRGYAEAAASAKAARLGLWAGSS